MPNDRQSKVPKDLVAIKDEKGKWLKGHSGNPAGRPVGSKNKITIMKLALEEAFRDDSFEDVLNVLKMVVDQAIGGDKSSQKLVWDSAVSKGMGAQDKEVKGDTGFTVHHMHHDVSIDDTEAKAEEEKDDG